VGDALVAPMPVAALPEPWDAQPRYAVNSTLSLLPTALVARSSVESVTEGFAESRSRSTAGLLVFILRESSDLFKWHLSADSTQLGRGPEYAANG